MVLRRSVAAGAMALLCVPGLARAQTRTATGTVTIAGGRRTITAATADAACTTPATMTAKLSEAGTFTATTALTSAPAYVWWTPVLDDCYVDEIPLDTLGEADLDPDAVNLGALDDVTFPTDFGTTFTEADFIARIDALDDGDPCTETAAVSRSARLCFGVDLDDNTALLATADTTTGAVQDWVGWADFEFDAAVPTKPEVILSPRDQGLLVEAAFPEGGEHDDLASFNLWIREANDDGLGCTAWPDTEEPLDLVDALALNATSIGHVVDGLENNLTYEVCLQVEDNVGQQSPISDIAVGAPIDECDFAECYPGGFPAGFCGAAGTPSLFVLGAIGLAWRRRRRSR